MAHLRLLEDPAIGLAAVLAAPVAVKDEVRGDVAGAEGLVEGLSALPSLVLGT